MTNYKIDDLDQKIIQLLSTDARLSNRKIATQLGFTEGTIRSRVKRLEDENFIRFTAVTNMSNLDTPQLAYIGIHAEQNSIKKVAERIAILSATFLIEFCSACIPIYASCGVSRLDMLVTAVKRMKFSSSNLFTRERMVPSVKPS